MVEPKFKIGDLIQCKEPGCNLVKDQLYTVIAIKGTSYQVTDREVHSDATKWVKYYGQDLNFYKERRFVGVYNNEVGKELVKNVSL